MPSANCQSLLYNWFPMFHLALPCTGQSHRIISPKLCVRSSPSMSRESLPNRVFILSFLLAFVFFLASFASAQDPQSDSSSQSGSASPQPQDKETDPLKRPLTEKQRKENEKRFKQEVSSSYKKWLNEDVAYIITDEERAAFKQLSNDEERDNFIEAFWQRRDPTPDTVENEFKEEHYRRIAYANEHFAAGIPGWKSDRGRIYIVYGPADEIESHPSGGTYERPMEEGGGSTSTYPFEDWRYRYIEGIGQEVIIEFVDDCMCGNYEMTMDRSKKDALLYTPNGGLTLYEQMGMASKANRFTHGGLERLGSGPFNNDLQTKQFDRLEQFYKLQKPPAVKFKDLEEVVSHKISVNLMPFDVRADFVRVTGETEPVAAKNVGTGNFVIGTMKVRPRVPSSDGKPVVFKRNQKMNFWMQVYNLGVDDKTHKSSATVEYDVVNAATNKPVVHTVESTEQMGNVGDQVTLQKSLSAANLDPGVYRIQIKVNDKVSKQTVDPSATFAVE